MTKDNVRFLPAKGDEAEGTHIAMTSGHACRVKLIGADGERGTPIPLMFRKAAIAQGCGVVGIDEDQDEGEEEAGPTKQDLIVKAITELVEGNDPAMLEGDGRPKLEAVKKAAGFNVSKKMFDDAWGVFTDSLED